MRNLSSASNLKHVAMKLKPTSLSFLFCTISQAFDNSGTCETSSHAGVSTKQFCCDFYEKINNGCVACADGFESFHGSPCKPCPNNTYGNWCAEKCVCATYQRCDHINGCVDVITTVDVNQGTVTTSTAEPQKEIFSTNRPNDILSDFSIYLALGMGSLVINIVFFAMCAIHYKRKRHSNYIISNAAMSPIEDVDIQEHAYDEIDENALSVELTNQEAVLHQHDKCDVSTASGSSRDDIPGHGYLTPYQPIVHYPNAIYKNLPLNSDIPHGSATSDCIVETYENTVVFY